MRKKTMVMTKITAFLMTVSVAVSGCGVKNDSNTVSQTEAQTVEEAAVHDFPASREYVKNIGRTHEENGVLWLAQSASGIEFTFSGKSASIDLVGDNAADGEETSQARYAVYINGERTQDGMVNQKELHLDVYSSDIEKETTVKLLKLSEAAQSSFGIKNITAESVGDIKPTKDKDLKIEFIGDSITCGYGVDDENRDHHFSTATEDATKTYAYKTAELLDADHSFVSYSGHGIISGYTSNGKKVTTQLVPKFYESFARTYGSSNGYYEVNADWDFSLFVPDIVVINLGTNDDSYVKGDSEKAEEYRSAYVQFLKKVRSDNPNAYIICSLGIMGDALYPYAEKAAEDYKAETSDTKVRAFHFKPQDGSTGYAADWHPTEATHEIAAKELAEYIKTLID